MNVKKRNKVNGVRKQNTLRQQYHLLMSFNEKTISVNKTHYWCFVVLNAMEKTIKSPFFKKLQIF